MAPAPPGGWEALMLTTFGLLSLLASSAAGSDRPRVEVWTDRGDDPYATGQGVRVLLGAKVHAHALAGCIGVVASVGPDLDAWAVGPGGGAGEQAEQPERGQHKCLPPPGRSRRHAIMRAQVPFPNWLSMATLQPRWTAVIALPLSSTRDNRPIISFRDPHG